MAGDKMLLEDWLDDLCVRFIINLPEEDLSSIARICFQIEEAQWFYEDFIRPLDPALPSMTLRSFSLRIFQHCPLLAPFSVENHTRAFEEFLQYKTRVPVRGAILLNEAMDSTVLVKGWKKGANWSFPRGKINKDEDDLECAIREVYEETGYDLHGAGLVPKDRDVKYIEITMREQQMRLYVFRNVPVDTQFAPRTRKEISKIQWYRLSELPAFRRKGANANNQNDAAIAANANKFYMVAPFLVPLKKWVVQQKKREARTAGAYGASHPVAEEIPTDEDTWAQNSHMPADPAPAYAGYTPALDTLEGATEELQRLLKRQQIRDPIPAVEEVPDKGASLLAMLKASSQVSVSGSQIPKATQGETAGYAIQSHRPYGNPHYQPLNQMPLQHPQPLPPQVQMNGGDISNTPQPVPGSHMVGPPASGSPSAQVAQPGRNQSTNLPNHSLALLHSFAPGSAPSSMASNTSAGAPMVNIGAAKSIVLNPLSNSSVMNSTMPGGRVGPPQPGQVTAQQRATLLSMFKKSEIGSPSENQQPRQPAGEALFEEVMASPPTTRADDGSSSPFRQQDADLIARLQQPSYISAVPNKVHDTSDTLLEKLTNRANMAPYQVVSNNRTHPNSPFNNTSTITQAVQERPASLVSPPATSSLPTPAILQRKQSMSHEQRSKLLSLFGKTQTPKTPTFVSATEEQGKGKEAVLPAASPISATSGSALHLSETRRGSQTPISPADRSFLLNYLASATSRAQ